MADGDQLGLAREHATDRVPTARAKQTVDEVRRSLVGQSFDSASDVAVLDEGELTGLLPIERLLAVESAALVEEVMDADPPIAAPDTNREAVAWEMINRGESSVAIVDSQGVFLGLIPPNRMLNVLMTEHDEDVARLGGYLASTDRARQAAEERVTRRLWHRLPWLLVGLVGAIASAGIIGAFEEELGSNVLLAFFIPGVVYMAAAIGTQTQTVLIRGFAVGVSLRHVLGRELISGLLLSLAISLAFLPVAAGGWGDTDVALGVTLALFASSIAATLVAIALPWGFQRAGADPAFGSGPLATVIQDLVTIGIYFAVAIPIAT